MNTQNRYLAIAGGVGLGILLLVAVSIIYWRPEVCAEVVDSTNKTAFPLFLIGSLILVVVLLLQWWTVTNVWRVNKLPLSEVERMHPHLPGSFEVIITLLLSIVLTTLFLQFGGAVLGFIFGLSSSTSESNDTRGVLVADFDLDGDLDYVAVNFGAAADLYLNTSTGAFTRDSTFAAGGYGFGAGDVDNDGDVDIVNLLIGGFKVAKNQYANGGTGFIQGDCGVSICTGPSDPVYNDLDLGDIDNDGDLDLILSPNLGSSTTALFINKGSGSFAVSPVSVPQSTKIEFAGINQDTHLDYLSISNTGDLRLYLGDGKGSFSLEQTLGGLSLVGAMDVADMNGDGTLDIIVADSSEELYLISSSATGSLSSTSIISSSLANIKSIAIGDIDNDGDNDFLVGSFSSGGANGGVAYYLNDGSGGFDTEYTTTQSSDDTYSVAFGDLDVDGDLDYIRGNDGVNRHYLSGQAAVTVNAAPTSPTGLTVTSTAYQSGTGTITSDSGTGSAAWSNPSNAGNSDDAYATATLPTNGTQSEYLEVSSLGMHVATGATVKGIEVVVERKASADTSIYDKAVRVIKNDTPSTAEDKAVTATAWETTDTEVTYGSATDLWGQTWLPSDINAATFGVVFSAISQTGSSVTASVDAITVNVYTSEGTVTLSWTAGTDSESVQNLLQYHVKVGTGSTEGGILTSGVSGPRYTDRPITNANVTSLTLNDLECDTTYYWSARTIDAGLRRSAFSTEDTFTIDEDCNVPSEGGGTGGSEDDPGGGWIWSFIRQGLGGGGYGFDQRITTDVLIRPFFDINRNGVKDIGERSGLVGHNVSVYQEEELVGEGEINSRGEIELELDVTSEPYDIVIDPETKSGYKYYITTELEPLVVEAGEDRLLEVGFTFAEVLQHFPCLMVSGEKPDSTLDGSIAFAHQIEDNFGQDLMRGLSLDEELISRDDFLTLLQRTQCVRVAPTLEEAFEGVVKRPSDLAFLEYDSSERVALALLKAGVPITKETSLESSVDLETPVTRGDAVRMLIAAMEIPELELELEDYPLPVDVEPETETAELYGLLDSLGVIPQTMRTIFAEDRGMKPEEAVTLLARAGYVMGRISLLDPDRFEVSDDDDDSDSVQTFLYAILEMSESKCLLSDPKRSAGFLFKNILPGQPFYVPMSSLLQYYIENRDDKKLWLVSGARTLTEFGIEKGVGRLSLNTPVSAIDTLRSVLLLSCRAPYTVSEVDQDDGSILGGADQFGGDRLFGLKKSKALEWRVAVKAQRPETFGNFSLFTFAKDLLVKPNRSPYLPFTVEEAGSLFGSVLSVIAATNRDITVQEASNRAAEAEERIIQDLAKLGQFSREEARLMPLTHGMLLYFMSVVADVRFETSEEERSLLAPSTSEHWFLRIMRSQS